MTTNPESTSEGSTGEYSLDEDDQLQAEDTLDDRGVDDVLDEGYSPPEQPEGINRFGTTADEQRQGESLAQHLAEEEPDPTSLAYQPDSPDSEWRSDEADSDPEFPEDEQVGGRRSGRLIAPDEGVSVHDIQQRLATDAGFDGGAASAEEAAVHVIDADDEF
ncbi:hypothetical protein DFR67_11970 [Williamsia limnetica]|jgi:hypothetical protein|uniref:DUF5709 domain-containing protein n=1 Tax=Williamsia limnetica TaxID=882452 RepID=A0A318RB14_WILLI|nr:DUF5709 domain-containing protein [Williamsia limnetica]PYE12963.1 hypothetical protein DFR67_11970 [Williamsia limnetica]